MADTGVEVVAGRVSYFEELQELCFLSTSGVDAQHRSTRFSLSAEGHVRERSSLSVSIELACRSFADACSRPLGAGVGKQIMAMCTAAARPEEPCVVVFSQSVIGGLLPKLLPAFENHRIESGGSFLSGRIGMPQGSSVVHIIDDASTPGGLQTRPFDARGIPPVPVPLWVEGVPTGRYLDLAAAHAAGLRSSGHLGMDGSLWPGNVIVRPGSRSRNMLFPDLGPLVICTELLGSKVNIKTGTLKLELRCYSADASGTHGYIGDLVMKTDVGTLLNSVIHLANDQERHGYVDTPTWILDGPWFE
jgi:PmbA protein